MQYIRVQGPAGTKRIDLPPTATKQELYDTIHDAFQLDAYNNSVYGEWSHTNELISSNSKTISDYKLKHGDIIYVKPQAGTALVN